MNRDVRNDHPAQLIEAVRGGSETAFESLLECYAPLLSSSVAVFSGDTTRTAEERMQEARYALYRAALSYREGSGVTFGLYAKICVRNALISGARRGKSEAPPFSLDELCDDGRYPLEDACRTDEILDSLVHTETVEELCRRIADVLSPYERKVFELYANSYSIAEIARKLSKSEKSVSNAVSRFTAKLRKMQVRSEDR